MYSGSIIPIIQKLINLRIFFIFNNKFTRNNPSKLDNLIQITLLKINFNDFSGKKSDKFCDLYHDPFSISMFYSDCGTIDTVVPPAVEYDLCIHFYEPVQKSYTNITIVGNG